MRRLKLDALNLPILEHATQHRKLPLYVTLAYSQSLIVIVGLGSVSAARHSNLSVRNVPIAAPHDAIFSV